MDNDRQPAGVITVFLSLLLPAFLTLFGTCLESARYEGLRLRGELAADAAAQAVFSCYDRPLYERYGLLFFCTAKEDGRELSEIAGAYAVKNTQGTQPGRGELLALKFVGAEVSGLRTAADGGGAGFAREVCTLMRESGRMPAALAAASDAGYGGLGEERIALTEYLMQTFHSLTDEAAGAGQLEACVTGTTGRGACEAAMRQRLYEERKALYLAYFREQAAEPAQEPPSDNEPGEETSAQPLPPETLAGQAAERDVRELFAGGAVAQYADGTGRQLTYLQILRGYLYQTEPALLRQRAMAVIESDLRDAEPGFAFSGCIGGATFCLRFRSEPLMPFSLFSRSYEYEFTTTCSY